MENVGNMEEFYTRHLGFVVTDRGSGNDAMIFLSRNPHEHHQLALNPRQSHKAIEGPVDHISFRVDSIANLKVSHKALLSSPAKLQTVFHGTTRSIYFRDPEDDHLDSLQTHHGM